MNDISKLRYWCYKILPLVYDDSLSYYEQLCKVVSAINEVIANVNQIPEEIAKSYKDTDAINEIMQIIFKDIKASITENDNGTDEYAIKDYTTGTLIWQNNILYRILHDVKTGDKLVLNNNYMKITIEDMLYTVYRSDDKTLYIRGIVDGQVAQPEMLIVGDIHTYNEDQKSIEIVHKEEVKKYGK